MVRVHGEIPGRTFLGEVYHVGAPNKTLISDTVFVVVGECLASNSSEFFPDYLRLVLFSFTAHRHPSGPPTPKLHTVQRPISMR